MRKPVFLIFVAVMLFSTACGCEKSTTSSSSNKPKDIVIKPGDLTVQIGDKEQLKAYSVPSFANAVTYKWESSDNDVASVTQDGIVKGISEGEAVITASYLKIKNEITVKVISPAEGTDMAVMYNLKPLKINQDNALQLNGAGEYTAEGLVISKAGVLIKLDKFYSLAERMVRYEIEASADAVMHFRSSQGDFNAYVDIANKTFKMGGSPTETVGEVPFIEGGKKFILEISHIYLDSIVRITDPESGESVTIKATQDGPGGAGKGVLKENTVSVGMHWDHYCFELAGGNQMTVKRMTVFALKKSVQLLIYGDSITQPEGYFPKETFPLAWTQRIISALGGNAMSSGRGGGTIVTVNDAIRNELPYIDAKYVMVTIGTNGGNTEENLTELVNYIKDQGSIPILNNIPSNESGTQIENAKIIEAVREKTQIKGCKFDLCTSVNGDGKEVDRTTMFWEELFSVYGFEAYHHPNEVGGERMYSRTLIDVPDIYE